MTTERQGSKPAFYHSKFQYTKTPGLNGPEKYRIYSVTNESSAINRKIYFCVFFLLLSAQAWADPIRLVTGEFPPFTSDNLENKGLATEIITLALEEMGHNAEITFLPWKRGYQSTLNGTFLGTFAYSKNAERTKTWLFSVPLYQLQEVFFTKKSSNIHFEDEADLYGLSVCKPIGYNLFKLRKLAENSKISLARPKSMDLCFSMLNGERIDLVMTNEATGWKIVEQYPEFKEKFRVLKKPFVDIGHHLIIPRSAKNGSAFLKQFNAIIQQKTKDGTIDSIVSKSIKQKL